MADVYARTRLDALRQLRREGYAVVDRAEAAENDNEQRGLMDVIDGWLEWIVQTKGDEPCRYDHHDYCQAHNLDERPCPMEGITAYVRLLHGITS